MIGDQTVVAGSWTRSAPPRDAFNARRVWWADGAAGLGSDAGAVAHHVVPTTEPPQLRIHVGELTGGRRLLSDDEALLDAVARHGGATHRCDPTDP